MIEIIVALLAAAAILAGCKLAYEIGRLNERRLVIERWRTAIDIFFEAKAEYSMPDWESSSVLIAYVAGAYDEPPHVRYVSILDSTGKYVSEFDRQYG